MNKLLLALIIIMVLGSCVSQKKVEEKIFDNYEEWLPRDFSPARGVLLIDKDISPASEEKKMEKYMAENYTGKYEFVKSKDILKGSAYDNVETYRFAIVKFRSGTSNDSRSSVNGTVTTHSYTLYDFQFYDRAAKRYYPKTSKPSSGASWTFIPIIHTVMEKAK